MQIFKAASRHHHDLRMKLEEHFVTPFCHFHVYLVNIRNYGRINKKFSVYVKLLFNSNHTQELAFNRSCVSFNDVSSVGTAALMKARSLAMVVLVSEIEASFNKMRLKKQKKKKKKKKYQALFQQNFSVVIFEEQMISVSVLCQFRPAVWKCVVVLLLLSISYSDFQAGINERSCWCLSSMGTGSTGRISKLSVPLLKSIDLGVRAIDKMVKGEEKEKDTHKKNDGILRWTLCRRLLANRGRERGLLLCSVVDGRQHFYTGQLQLLSASGGDLNS
ncbi:hypothetical protein T05_11075 [Trichinella murrelli]|uniref:Uncharacterized protein n=1 Tax=Trichinella murrelli TaxID=144512 RepID=A0A0V0UIE7_9BILA|nr:hypothetical protein T05_11075 [Trichinella murrelli]